MDTSTFPHDFSLNPQGSRLTQLLDEHGGEVRRRHSRELIRFQQTSDLLNSTPSLQLDGTPPLPGVEHGLVNNRPKPVHAAAVLESLASKQVDRLELGGDEPRMENMTYGDLINHIEKTYGVQVDGTFGGFFVEHETAIDEPVDESALEDYFSPEKTADRIVTFATNFLDAYLDNHNDETDREGTLAEFRELIEGAIDKGFDQAREMLGASLNEVGEGYLQETRGIITVKLDDYFSRLTGSLTDVNSPNVEEVS